jgi:hypothetical protein
VKKDPNILSISNQIATGSAIIKPMIQKNEKKLLDSIAFAITKKIINGTEKKKVHG